MRNGVLEVRDRLAGVVALSEGEKLEDHALHLGLAEVLVGRLGKGAEAADEYGNFVNTRALLVEALPKLANEKLEKKILGQKSRGK